MCARPAEWGIPRPDIRSRPLVCPNLVLRPMRSMRSMRSRSVRGGFVSRSRGPLQKVCHGSARIAGHNCLPGPVGPCYKFDWLNHSKLCSHWQAFYAFYAFYHSVLFIYFPQATRDTVFPLVSHSPCHDYGHDHTVTVTVRGYLFDHGHGHGHGLFIRP